MRRSVWEYVSRPCVYQDGMAAGWSQRAALRVVLVYPLYLIFPEIVVPYGGKLHQSDISPLSSRMLCLTTDN